MENLIEYIKWNDPTLYETYMKQKEKNNVLL
jgi:hypothetical protein